MAIATIIDEKNVSDTGSGAESTPSLETIYNKDLSDNGAGSESLDRPYVAIAMGENGAGSENVGNRF
jgi:hypothetical protein